jgi:competence protein ComEC
MELGMVMRAWAAGISFTAFLCGCDVQGSSTPPAPEARLVVPYVGQGAGALLLLPRAVVAFDAGPDSSDAMSEALDRQGVETIDLMVVSHWDLDHVGGLERLVGQGRIRRLVHGAEPAEAWMSVRKEAWCRRIPEGCATVAGHRSLSDGFRLEFHTGDAESRDDNSRSLVARLVDAAGTGLLLAPGDLDTTGESRLLASDPDLRAQVLLVGHHGSRSSSSLPFLGAVGAKTAIVQAGSGNRYGHPHVEALERLRHLVEDLRWVRPQTTERLDLGTDP